MTPRTPRRLNALLDTLDLRGAAVLVGHSMGTGEITRYLGTYGSARVAKGVLVSPIPPFLLQAGNNPEGLPAGLFDGFVQAATADTPAWMKGFWTTSTRSTSSPAPWSATRPSSPAGTSRPPRVIFRQALTMYVTCVP